jgi:uncharacterized membrane protein
VSEVAGNQAAPGKARWLKIALIVSLALNLMAIGIAAGFILKPHKDFHSPAMSFHHMTKDLSPESRALIKNITKKHKDKFRGMLRQIHQQRRAISDLLAAETVDKAELEAAFERLQQLSSDFQGSLHQVMIEAAQQLPREDRQKLQKGLQAEHKWKFKEKHRDDRSPSPDPAP